MERCLPAHSCIMHQDLDTRRAFSTWCMSTTRRAYGASQAMCQSSVPSHNNFSQNLGRSRLHEGRAHSTSGKTQEKGRRRRGIRGRFYFLQEVLVFTHAITVMGSGLQPLARKLWTSVILIAYDNPVLWFHIHIGPRPLKRCNWIRYSKCAI